MTKSKLAASILVWFGGESHPVANLAEASKVFAEWRDLNGLGASDLKRKDGIVYIDGRPAARVSYNGRVWDAQGKEIKVAANLIHSDNDLGMKLEPAHVPGPEAGPSNDELHENSHPENAPSGSPVLDGGIKSPERQNVNAIREAIETQAEMEVGKPIQQKQQEVAIGEKVRDEKAMNPGATEVSAKPGTQIIINVASSKKCFMCGANIEGESKYSKKGKPVCSQACASADAKDAKTAAASPELKKKLHPQRFSGASGKWVAIVGFILGEKYTDPQITEMAVTGDGMVMAGHSDDIGMNDMVGSELDLQNNWKRYCEAAGLDAEEMKEANSLFRSKIVNYRTGPEKSEPHAWSGTGTASAKAAAMEEWCDACIFKLHPQVMMSHAPGHGSVGACQRCGNKSELRTVQIKRSAEPIGGEDDSKVTSGHGGGMFGGTDLTGPQFHVGFTLHGRLRTASFSSVEEADRFVTSASERFRIAGLWTMKCPWCGGTAEKEKPMDNWHCGCGWSSDKDSKKADEKPQSRRASETDPAHRTLVFQLLKTGPKTTGEIEKALGGGQHTNKAWPIMQELAKDGIVSHKQMRWHLKSASECMLSTPVRVRTAGSLPEKGSPEWAQLQIAIKTLKMPDAMVGVMGPPNKQSALETLARYGLRWDDEDYMKGGKGVKQANEKKAGTIDQDTPILPHVVADAVVRELALYFYNKHGINLFDDDALDLADQLATRADTLYVKNESFRKKILGKGNSGRDYLYAFMRHWLSGIIYEQNPGLADKIPADFKNGLKVAGEGVAKTPEEIEKEAGFNFFFPGQVLKEFYPEIQHEIVDYPNANNQPMALEQPGIVGDAGHELEGVLDEALDTGIVEMIQLPADVGEVEPLAMTSADYSPTKPGGAMGIGRDGKPEVLEGVPLRKENDIRGMMFTDEFYGQYEGIPGAALAVASKTAASDEAKQFAKFLKMTCGEIAATMVAAFRVTQRPLLDKVPGVGEVSLDQVEQLPTPTYTSVTTTSTPGGSRVKYLLGKLNDSDIKAAINGAWAQAAVWNDAPEGGFIYEVFVRPETIDTDSMVMKYKFITGTRD